MTHHEIMQLLLKIIFKLLFCKKIKIYNIIRPVIVSVWPCSVYTISFFLRSYILILLSIPPAKIFSAVSLNCTAVIWYLFSKSPTLFFYLRSQIRVLPSSAPDAINSIPLLDIWQLFTNAAWLNFLILFMFSVSQIATALSALAVIILELSVDQCKSKIAFVWPFKTAIF